MSGTEGAGDGAAGVATGEVAAMATVGDVTGNGVGATGDFTGVGGGETDGGGGEFCATIAGGLAFVILHASEWRHLILDEHVTPFHNEWNVPLFGGTFFTLTGLHMTHVVIGVIYLGIIAFAVGRGKFKAEDVEVSGLYWHFVDLVWMFIFPLVYLMSAKV